MNIIPIELPELSERPCSAVFSKSLPLVGLRMPNSAPRIYDFINKTFVDTGMKEPASGMAFRPAGPEQIHEIALTGSNRHVERLALKGNRVLPPLAVKAGRCVAYSPDGSHIAVGTEHGAIRVWHLRLSELPKDLVSDDSLEEAILQLAFSVDNQYLYGITASGANFQLWIGMPGSEAIPYLLHKNGSPTDWDCYAIDTHPELRWLALAGEGSAVYLAATATGEITTLHTGLGAYVRQAYFWGWHLVLIGQNGVEIWALGPARRIARENLSGPNVIGCQSYGDQLCLACV